MTVHIGNIAIGEGQPLLIVAGPCVIEGPEMIQNLARFLKTETQALGLGYVFKSSYDKANRTSVKSFRGPGIKDGLALLKALKEETGVLVISDVHRLSEVDAAAQVLDVIQIPAFLCRQTDLVQAVARTGRVINVKKGQFLSPWDVASVIEKITAAGSENIIITGGMGPMAQQLFQQASIEVVLGATAGEPEAVTLAYLNGTLSQGSNTCDH